MSPARAAQDAPRPSPARSRRGPFGLAVAAALSVAACLAPSATSPGGYGAPGPAFTDARVSFIHPWFTLPNGAQTGAVAIRVDGDALEPCTRDDRSKQVACVDRLRLAPGRHMVHVEIDQAGLSSTFFHTDDVLFAAPFEDVVYDLSRAAGHDPRAYVSRSSLAYTPPACEGALLAVASAPACSAAELGAVAQRLEAARRVCGRGDEARGSGALWMARANVLDGRAGRCFSNDQLPYETAFVRKAPHLPRVFSDARVAEGFWPKGTVTAGSWAWAHDVVPPEPDARMAPPPVPFTQQIVELQGLVGRVRERVAMLEDFIGPWLQDVVPAAAVERALASPFDLDPRSAAGHRLNLLLRVTGNDWRSSYDERLARYIAQAFLAYPIACTSSVSDTRHAVNYLFSNGQMTDEKWRALQALIARTPPGEPGCSEAFYAAASDRLAGGPPQEQRATWLAGWECQPGRDRRFRGSTTEAMTRPDNSHMPPDMKARIRGAFAGCLARP